MRAANEVQHRLYRHVVERNPKIAGLIARNGPIGFVVMPRRDHAGAGFFHQHEIEIEDEASERMISHRVIGDRRIEDEFANCSMVFHMKLS